MLGEEAALTEGEWIHHARYEQYPLGGAPATWLLIGGRGSISAFRFRDPFDWKSCALAATPTPFDQTIGTGDGATRAFALTKTYGSGPDAYVRPIAKPVAGTVRIAVSGVEIAAADIDLDPNAGVATFAASATPAAGAPVTAGYEFDVAVRFDTDALTLNIASFKAGQIPHMPLVEVMS